MVTDPEFGKLLNSCTKQCLLLCQHTMLQQSPMVVGVMLPPLDVQRRTMTTVVRKKKSTTLEIQALQKLLLKPL